MWNVRFTWTQQTINLSLILFLACLDLLTHENKGGLFRTGSVLCSLEKQTISVKTTIFNAVQDFTEATIMPEATKTPGLKWLWFMRLSLTLWAYMCSSTDTTAWELSSSQNKQLGCANDDIKCDWEGISHYVHPKLVIIHIFVCLSELLFWNQGRLWLCFSRRLWSDSKETYYATGSKYYTKDVTPWPSWLLFLVVYTFISSSHHCSALNLFAFGLFFLFLQN